MRASSNFLTTLAADLPLLFTLETCRYLGDDLLLQSVSEVNSNCTDPTFGPCTRIDLAWGAKVNGATVPQKQ